MSGLATRLRPRTKLGLAATSVSSSRRPSSVKASSSRTSGRDSSGSSVFYINSGSESGSDGKDLPDPADLLKTLSSKVIKVEKRSVDAMDVDDEPAAPPPKKVNRSAKGVSTVSNAAESSSQARERPVPRPKNAGARAHAERTPDPRRLSGAPSVGRPLAPPPPIHRERTRVVDLESITIEENLQIDESFEFEISRVRSSGYERIYTFHVQDAEEIGKTYKAVEARDPHGFRKTMEIFATEGFALSHTGDWLLSFGKTVGDLVAFFNAVCLIGAAVQYRYGILEPMDPLPSDPDHPIFLDAGDPQPRWRQYTRDVFPPFDGQRYISMGGYDAAWAEYKTALSQHEESESVKEAAFMERQRSKFSEWKKRAKEYRDKIPGLHQHQSERVLSYIKEREGILCEFRRARTPSVVISCIASAPNLKKKTAPSRAASLPGRPERRERPLSVKKPRLRHRHRRSLANGSTKGKGKSKMDAAPAPLSKKKSPVQSDDGESEHAGSEHVESAGEGSEDEGGDTSRIITRKVKVKQGKRLVNVEMTGPRSTYDSAEWHQANNLFVFDVPLTSTGGNKIVTHAYPYDEKHPRFSKTWKRQVTLASLPTCSFFTRGKGCVRCLLAESDCVRLRYGDDAPTGACMHCRADNVTCEASPVEFDWEVTDGALPDINAEFLELQLMLMLEIAEQVGGTGTTERLLARFMHHLRVMGTDEDVLQTWRAIFGSVNSSPVSGKFQFRQNPMLREEGDDRTDDSETEVEVRKGDESGDVSMDGVIGEMNEGPPLTSSASASGESSPTPAPPIRLRMDAVEIPSRAAPPLAAPRDPRRLFPSSSPGPMSTPRKSVPMPLQTPRSPPAVAASSSLSLSTLIFGKAGSLLSTKPNETSEGGAGGGDKLEEGELDTEGEIVVGNPRVRRWAQGRT
ncbi:hypothetical protein B0H13DRAFT_1894190 [Mycena leptocephala]|nr:hypothetical protein B0H13DRAFT_1894190 [Mycena leptocephala]